MYSPAPERADSFAQQVGLKELWSMFIAGWPIMVLSIVAAAVVAGAYYFMTRSEFEASFTIAIGQVATSGKVQNIESVDATIERMGSPEFVDKVVDLLAWRGDERQTLLERTYSVYPVASSRRYIKLRVRSYTAEDARRAGETAFAMLADAQRAIAQRIAAETTSRLATIASDISNLEDLLADIDSILGGDVSPIDRVQLQTLAIEERVEMRTLRLSQTKLLETAGVAEVEDRTTVRSVEVPQSPVFPDKWRVVVLATFTGFFVGVLLIASRALYRAEKDRRAALRLQRSGQLPQP